jgi:hypothetical protein
MSPRHWVQQCRRSCDHADADNRRGKCRGACCSTRQQSPSSPGSSAIAAGAGTCVATNAQSAIGQRASQQLLEQARVAATASTARFIRPNEPITTEYLGSRLNLQLDLQDVVRAVSCG